LSSPPKGVYNPKAVVLHAALLGQACAHCRKFLAAASRRSLGRLSVPVWLIVLTDQLPVTGLVGRYPTNYLMGRGPLQRRIAAFFRAKHGTYAGLAPLSQRYPPPQGRYPRLPQPCATHPAEAGCVRLACIRHAASVRPEPGSNSSCGGVEGDLRPHSRHREQATEVVVNITIQL
jgi:hypothetical protein